MSSSSIVRPTASTRCGHSFSAFEVTPPPQAFGSPGGRPSNSATLTPARARRSAANDPAGPAPTTITSNSFMHGHHKLKNHRISNLQASALICGQILLLGGEDGPHEFIGFR